ncbi:uncharacterized protein TNCV_2283501 [Trichonephila clavipes]|nr:uncharacterized protein TNCV_2283501 [Trichonephila clavipes]
MTLPQSHTVQLPCSRHHFNRAPLDWTNRGTQTQGTRAYSPFICNLRRTVAADIALPMGAVTMDVTRVKVALRFRLATLALHWCAKIKDEVEKLASQLNAEAERIERPIRRLSKVMYGSTCADMQVDVMGECLSSIKHVVGVRSVFLAKRLHAE